MRIMKHIIIGLISCLLGTVSYAQTKKELQARVEEQNKTIVRHEAQIQIMEKTISDLTTKIARLEAQLDLIQLQNNRIENNIYRPNQPQPTIESPTQTNRQNIQPSARSQCRGITKAGNRCKRSAGPSGYCYQHGN